MREAIMVRHLACGDIIQSDQGPAKITNLRVRGGSNYTLINMVLTDDSHRGIVTSLLHDTVVVRIEEGHKLRYRVFVTYDDITLEHVETGQQIDRKLVGGTSYQAAIADTLREMIYAAELGEFNGQS